LVLLQFLSVYCYLLYFGFLKPELPVECAMWDKYYVMEVVLFLTGFTLRYMMTNQTFLMYMYSDDKVSVETA
jgi:hypothetical protein